ATWAHQGWSFRNGVIRTFKENGTDIDQVIPFQEKTLGFVEKPSDLVTQEPQAEQMNYKTLKTHIKRLAALGVPVRKFQVELFMKLAFPFASLIVIFLGIPLGLAGKGSKALGIAAGGFLSLTYMGFIELGKALAQRLIPPLAGAWIANIVFLAVGTLLWVRM